MIPLPIYLPIRESITSLLSIIAVGRTNNLLLYIPLKQINSCLINNLWAHYSQYHQLSFLELVLHAKQHYVPFMR